MNSRVPFIKPRFPDSSVVAADFEAIVSSGRFSNFGPFERRFSEMVASYVGLEFHAVSFANATVALIATIQAVVGRGDGSRHILVPSFTFAAGAESIEWCGYRPLFIDIEPVGLQPSLAEARSVVAQGTYDVAAVLLCNTVGIGNAEIDEWCAWADDRGLPLVVDSAAGFGSKYGDGTRLGRAGAAEVFSFHATKPFAIGEGGAVVTRDAELASRLMSFENFGFGPEGTTTALGLNGKLTELAAAIGIRQFEVFESELASRRKTVARYRRELGGLGYVFPRNIEASSVCFATVLAPTPETRDRATLALSDLLVDARHYYAPPLHTHPHFADAAVAGDLAVTLDVSRRVLSVPVHPFMSSEASDSVILGLSKGATP